MAILLFPHNQTAYAKAEAMLEKHKKAAVIHPTGTGKSFIAFKLAEDHPGARICWLAPSGYIFQTQRENFLKAGGSEGVFRNIHFLTYARLMHNRDLIGQLAPDYIVLDEFHRCGASEWGKGVKGLLEAYPEAKVLGLSATNVRYLDSQRDMADELFEGKIASRMSLGDAIAQNILPAPVYVTTLYSYGDELKKLQKRVDGLKNTVQQKQCESILRRLTRSLQNADGPDVIFQRYMNPSGKYLVFCANKEHMDEMMELAAGKDGWFRKLDREPNIYQAYYDSSESRAQFQAFCRDDSSRLKLLYCIDMLNEGIHVADVDGVILLRPTISPILYLQQVGRALSAAGGRQPVIFDMVNNFDGLYSVDSLKEQMEEAFCVLPDSIRGRWQERFRIFDEVRDCRQLFEQLQRNLNAAWDTYYYELEKYRETHHDLLVPKDYITESGLNLGMWLTRQRGIRRGRAEGMLTEEQIGRLDRLGMVWDVNDNAWEKYYRAAEQYRRENHNLNVPKTYVTGTGLALGSWIMTQRRVRQGSIPGSLTEEKIARLDQLGMQWESANEAKWSEGYRHLLAFREAYGHVNVANGYVAEDGYRLGRWLNNQRTQYVKEKMAQNRLQLLQEAGVVWEVLEVNWQKYYSAAEEYYRENGNLRVPAGFTTEDGIPLGTWISAKRRNKNTLSAERKAALDKIGMVWEVYSQDRWKTNYSLAQTYYREHGHLNVPKDFETDGVKLGRWICRMRERRKPNASRPLTEEQIKSLDAIGMAWDSSWDIRFQEARVYYELHGDLRVPQTYVTDSRIWLGRWVYEQKKKHGQSGRKGLTEDQIKKLEGIGMRWD